MTTPNETEITSTEITDTAKRRQIPLIYLGLAFLCTAGIALDKALGFNPRPTEVAATFAVGLVVCGLLLLFRPSTSDFTKAVRTCLVTAISTSLAAACLAAAEVNNNGWYLVATVLVGIAATVYVLRSKVDEYISLTMMFCVTAFQVGAIYFLLR